MKYVRIITRYLLNVLSCLIFQARYTPKGERSDRGGGC